MAHSRQHNKKSNLTSTAEQPFFGDLSSDDEAEFRPNSLGTTRSLKSSSSSVASSSKPAHTPKPHAASSSLTVRLPGNNIDLSHFSHLTVTMVDEFGVKHSFKAKTAVASAQSSTKSSRSSGVTPSSSYQAPPKSRQSHGTDADIEMTVTPSSSLPILKAANELTCSSSDEDEAIQHLDSDSDSSDHEQLDDHFDQDAASTPSIDLEEMDEDGDIFHDCVDYDPDLYEPQLPNVDDIEAGAQRVYAKPSWSQRLYSNTIGYVGELITYTYNKPKEASVDFAKWSISALLGLIATAPAAINALAAPSGKSAKEISAKWFNEMSNPIKALSITNAFFSTYVNLPLNKFFVVNAWDRFKTSIKQIFNSPRQFFDNTLAILFGIGGGIAAGSIALNSFAFLPLWAAAFAAGIGFVLTATSRYLGSKKAFLRFYNAFFNQDAKTQRDLLDAVNHLQPHIEAELQADSNIKAIRLLKRHHVAEQILNAHCQEHNKQKTDLTETDKKALAKQLMDTLHTTTHSQKRLLKHLNLKRATSLINHHANKAWDKNQPFTTKDFELLYKNLAHALNRLETQYQQNIFRQKTTAESIAEYSGAIFDVVAAISLVAAPTWLMFMQKGFDGINALRRFTTHQTPTDLDKLNIWEKRAIGVVPAFASSILYGIWTADFRSVMIDTFNRLKADPSQIPMAALWLIANGFAASSMTYVGKGVVNTPNNLLGTFFNTQEMKELLPILIGAGGFFVNYTPNANTENTLPLEDACQPTIAEITTRLRDPNTYFISEHSASSIQKQFMTLSFFNAMQQKLARNAAQEQESRDVSNTEPSHLPL